MWNRNPKNFAAWTWDNEANVSVSGALLSITIRRVTASQESNRVEAPHFFYTSGMLTSMVVDYVRVWELEQ